MSDGHSGIECKKVNEGGSGNFQLVLAYLKQGTGRGDFVMHSTSNTFYSYGLQPLEFLAEIGFIHSPGECPFYRDKCFYRVIATLERHTDGLEHFDRVHRIHGAFKAFAGKIGELFELRQQEDRILRDIGLDSARKAPVFGAAIKIEIDEKDVPLWVDAVKFPRLRELEGQKATLEKEIDELSGFLPLLYGTGDLLEGAVIEALRLLGLDVERAPKGFTADILAQTCDGSRKFAFEITGISGPVRKDSKKLTQLLEFERIKEHGEKTVLVANTHNATPIRERKDLEDFTQPVLDFLGRHPILLMTGWDLYCMVGDVLEGSRTKEDLVETLYTTNGRLDYTPRVSA